MQYSPFEIFYVYAYLDPRKPGKFYYSSVFFEYEPFYIGKGTGSRSDIHLLEAYSTDTKSYKCNKIRKIKSETGKDPIIVILLDNAREKPAFDLESKLVNEEIGFFNAEYYGMKVGPLTNQIPGGSQPPRKYGQDHNWAVKEDGSSYMQDLSDQGLNPNQIRSKNGTHQWFNPETNPSVILAKEGKHYLQGPDHNRYLVENGLHPFMTKDGKNMAMIQVERGAHPRAINKIVKDFINNTLFNLNKPCSIEIDISLINKFKYNYISSFIKVAKKEIIKKELSSVFIVNTRDKSYIVFDNSNIEYYKTDSMLDIYEKSFIPVGQVISSEVLLGM